MRYPQKDSKISIWQNGRSTLRGVTNSKTHSGIPPKPKYDFKSRLVYLLFALTLLPACILFGDIPPGQAEAIPPNLPWLTGPLLCPAGRVIPQGNLNFEPYLFGTTIFGTYDSHWHTQSLPHFYSVSSVNPIQYGLPFRFDVQVIPQFSWNHTDGASHWVINDLPLVLDFQLLYDKPNYWWPAIKLLFSVTAPIGKYEKLDPEHLGTDASGSGSWNPTLGLTFARLFTFDPTHFLSARCFVGYTFPHSLHVKGLNAYGGDPTTQGTVHSGASLNAIAGLEYTPTPHWALACDFQYSHQNTTYFHGDTLLPVGGPSSEEFSIAPAIEYNWNAYVGLIAGVWFSVAGRNTTQFASGIVAVNIYW